MCYTFFTTSPSASHCAHIWRYAQPATRTHIHKRPRRAVGAKLVMFETICLHKRFATHLQDSLDVRKQFAYTNVSPWMHVTLFDASHVYVDKLIFDREFACDIKHRSFIAFFVSHAPWLVRHPARLADCTQHAKETSHLHTSLDAMDYQHCSK